MDSNANDASEPPGGEVSGTPRTEAAEDDDDVLEDLFESQRRNQTTINSDLDVDLARRRPLRTVKRTEERQVPVPTSDATDSGSFSFLSLPAELIRNVLEFLLYSGDPGSSSASVPSPSSDYSEPGTLKRPTPSLLHPLLFVCSLAHIHAADLLYSACPTFLSSSPDSLPNFTAQLTQPFVPAWRRAQYTLIKTLDVGWSGEDFYHGPVWQKLLSTLSQLEDLTIRHTKTRSRARERHSGPGKNAGDADSSALLPVILNGLSKAGPGSLEKLVLVGFAFDAGMRTGLGLLKGWCWRGRADSVKDSMEAVGKTLVPQPTSQSTSLSRLSLITSRFSLVDLADMLTGSSGSWLESLIIEESTMQVDEVSGTLDRLPKWSSSLKRRRSVVAPDKAGAEREKAWKLNELATAPEPVEAEEGEEEAFFYEAYAPGPYAASEPVAEPEPVSLPTNSSPSQQAASNTHIPHLFSAILHQHSSSLTTLSLLHNSVLSDGSSVSFPIRTVLPFISAERLPGLKRLSLDVSTLATVKDNGIDELVAFFSGLPELAYLSLQGMPGDKILALSTLASVETLVLLGSTQPSLDPLARITGLKTLYLLDCRDLLWAPDALDGLCPVDDGNAGLERVWLRLGVIQSHQAMEQGAWFSAILARGFIGGTEVLGPGGSVVGVRRKVAVGRVERSRGPGWVNCSDEGRVRRPVIGRRGEDDWV